MATILVVDDREINRKFLASLLRDAGHTVVEAAESAETIQIMRAQRPDLVITEILTPAMDGVDFANAVHADGAIAAIPIVFYTGKYRLHEAKSLGQSCGVDVVLTKQPSSPRTIIDAVATALGTSGVRVPPIDESSNAVDAMSRILPPTRKDLSDLRRYLKQTLDQGLLLLEGDAGVGAVSKAIGQSFANMHALSVRLATLVELDLVMTSQRDPKMMLELFCQGAQNIMDSAYAAVGILDASGRRLEYWATHGLDDAANAAFASIDPLRGALANIFEHSKPFRIDGPVDAVSEIGLHATHPPIRNFLGVRIPLATSPGGVVYFANRRAPGPFGEEDEQVAEALVGQFALIYENFLLYDEIQRSAARLQIEIAERKRAVKQLHASELRFRQVAENIREIFFLVDVAFREILYVSPAYEEMCGVTCASLYAEPMSWANLVHPDDRVRVLAAFAGVSKPDEIELEYRIVLGDGSTRWLWTRLFPILDDAGILYRFVGITENVTERKEKEQKLARSTRIYAVLSAINSAIVRIHDRQVLFEEACRIAVVDGAFKMAWIGEVDPVTLNGKVLASHGMDEGYVELVEFSGGPDAPNRERPSSRAARDAKPVVLNDLGTDLVAGPQRTQLLERGHHSLAVFPLIVGGRVAAVFSLHSNERSFFDEEEIRVLSQLAGDVSFALEYIAKEQKLDYLAYYDALTGLPNSALFRDRLLQLLGRAEHERSAVALYLVDLDNFTHINDALGRAAGDILLMQVAERFGGALPRSSSLARISGDTFAVAVAELGDAADASVDLLEDHIFWSLQQGFMVDGHELRVSAQVGIALFPGDGSDADTLFKNAEAALKQVKASTERYLFYAPEMHARMVERLALESQLRGAVKAEEFVLHYQPTVDLSSGQVVGSEALLRWQHPQRGLLLPAQFLDVAEGSDAIYDIGDWVLRSACMQTRRWHEAGLPAVSVSVNLSARQFQDEGLVQRVARTLEDTRLDPRLLELELTENIVMHDAGGFVERLEALKGLGVKLSLDDFGTGYSSLSYLKRFPLDRLKVDRSFIRDVTTSPDDAAIVRAVISVGHSLGLDLVAEGVETEAQVEWLRRERCEQIQGYFFSPPLAAAEFEWILRSRKSLPFRHASDSMESKTLLIVDDEANIIASLVRLLRKDGYRVLTAPSAEEALNLLALNVVHVIVSDQRMPVMTGAEFFAKVRVMYPDTVRILFSGYIELETLTDAVNRGAVYRFLLKPWDDEVLRENIRQAFRYYWQTHRGSSEEGSLPNAQRRSSGANA